MTQLDRLLDQARKADPRDRILHRDPIASHGIAAIPAMQEWILDPQLGAFAVRVLERMASDRSNRGAVLDALSDARTRSVPRSIALDIEQALDHLSGGRAERAANRPTSPAQSRQWPGGQKVSPLELRFHEAMLGIFTRAGEATRKRRADGSIVRGYWASYFLRGVRNHGGLEYARQLLRAAGTSAGFRRLSTEGRLDLSMEALVLRPEFADLFSETERQIATGRLSAAGFDLGQTGV
jgi:hypothetical protein